MTRVRKGGTRRARVCVSQPVTPYVWSTLWSTARRAPGGREEEPQHVLNPRFPQLLDSHPNRPAAHKYHTRLFPFGSSGGNRKVEVRRAKEPRQCTPSAAKSTFNTHAPRACVVPGRNAKLPIADARLRTGARTHGCARPSAWGGVFCSQARPGTARRSRRCAPTTFSRRDGRGTPGQSRGVGRASAPSHTFGRRHFRV